MDEERLQDNTSRMTAAVWYVQQGLHALLVLQAVLPHRRRSAAVQTPQLPSSTGIAGVQRVRCQKRVLLLLLLLWHLDT
jgi:hypothetical protein